VDTCAAAVGCEHLADLAVSAPCYPADPTTEGKGACHGGTKTCQADGSFGLCLDAVTPAAAEACDGKDDDCDGDTDEGFAVGPKQVRWRAVGWSLAGQGGGASWRALGGAGAASAGGPDAAKTTVRLGFWQALRALGLGGKAGN
jgi:hypothetical protein